MFYLSDLDHDGVFDSPHALDRKKRRQHRNPHGTYTRVIRTTRRLRDLRQPRATADANGTAWTTNVTTFNRTQRDVSDSIVASSAGETLAFGYVGFHSLRRCREPAGLIATYAYSGEGIDWRVSRDVPRLGSGYDY
jgi:hypothetical protein